MSEYMEQGFEAWKQKVRAEHEARKEAAGDISSEPEKQPERVFIKVIPQQLRLRDGESTYEQAARIQRQAAEGCEVSRKEWLTMKGELQALQGDAQYRDEGVTGLDPNGNPRDGFTLDAIEEAHNDAYHKRIYKGE